MYRHRVLERGRSSELPPSIAMQELKAKSVDFLVAVKQRFGSIPMEDISAATSIIYNALSERLLLREGDLVSRGTIHERKGWALNSMKELTEFANQTDYNTIKEFISLCLDGKLHEKLPLLIDLVSPSSIETMKNRGGAWTVRHFWMLRKTYGLDEV